MPGSLTTGVDEGAWITVPPPSQQGAGAAAGPQAGSHAGAWHGSACPRHGERNSMNEGRRQLFPPPKQLLHPGAATRQPRTSARHT